MRKIIFSVFCLIGIAIPFVLSAQSSKGDVAIIYNGVNGVNKEAVNHIRKEAPHMGFDYSFRPVKAGTEISPEKYIAMVILNTDRESGIDPVLSEFINKQEDKSRLILVSLKKGSRDYVVQGISASPETEGVDAVSAASLWKSPGLGSLFKGNREIRAMHDEWLGDVLSFIQERNS
jgi:menaquinone-dependent protoporphyrinogen IX oxidase